MSYFKETIGIQLRRSCELISGILGNIFEPQQGKQCSLGPHSSHYLGAIFTNKFGEISHSYFCIALHLVAVVPLLLQPTAEAKAAQEPARVFLQVLYCGRTEFREANSRMGL